MIVSFEGLDGSGKSTQVEMFKRALAAAYYTVEVVPQFPWTPKIQDPNERMKLFQTIEEYRIHLALLLECQNAHRSVIILDRSIDTTYAYSWLFFRKLSHQIQMEYQHSIDAWFFALKQKPDFTFFIDAAFSTCQERLKARASENDVEFDGMSEEAWEAVHTRYAKIDIQEPKRFQVVVGSRPAEEVQAEIFEHFKNKFSSMEKS